MWDAESCTKKTNKCTCYGKIYNKAFKILQVVVNAYGFATLLINQQLDLFGIVMKGAHHLFVGRKNSCTLPSGSTNDTTSPSPTTSGDGTHCAAKADERFYNIFSLARHKTRNLGPLITRIGVHQRSLPERRTIILLHDWRNLGNNWQVPYANWQIHSPRW